MPCLQPRGLFGASRPRPCSGPPSECEPFREQILAKVEQGLAAKRISQDLAEEHRESAPGYYSVRRFVARLQRKTPLPFRRMETVAGRRGPGGLRHRRAGSHGRMASVRRPWIFRIVLSLQPQGVQRGRLAADPRKPSFSVWRTPFVISAACPSGWSSTTSRRPWRGPTGTIPRSIPSCNRSPSTTARCSCPPSPTRRVTRARSKAA